MRRAELRIYGAGEAALVLRRPFYESQMRARADFNGFITHRAAEVAPEYFWFCGWVIDIEVLKKGIGSSGIEWVFYSVKGYIGRQIFGSSILEWFLER